MGFGEWGLKRCLFPFKIPKELKTDIQQNSLSVKVVFVVQTARNKKPQARKLLQARGSKGTFKGHLVQSPAPHGTNNNTRLDQLWLISCLAEFF